MTNTDEIKRRHKKRPFIWIAAFIFLIGIGVLIITLSGNDEGIINNHATFTAKQGPLTISIIESGTIKAREQAVIKNEVEGRTSIISLVEEGVRVKKGDLLIELDSSELLDKKIDQQISVQNTEAAFVSAREDLAVVENQAQSDIDKAQLAYEFSKQDLNKYLEGEYPNELKEAESRITLAKEELARAREKLEWSKKLFNERYISQTELQADELAEKKKLLDLELTQNNLSLLKDFTHKRKLAQLESDVKQADMALDRTTRKAKADVVQARANLKAKEAEFERQKDKLNKIEEQIAKTKIYAPADGLVVYATSAQRGRRGRPVEPLQEGLDVRERQELIYLPTTSSAKAEVAIHEASLDKISIGLPARITVDALSGERFTGHVAKIAPLPDPQSAFLNPDLKVYNTDIFLDRNSDTLRTGMSCKAEIIIAHYEMTTYIPVQAVLRVGGKPTVYTVKSNTLEPRHVEIGLDNNRMVRIISGLEPGEVVSLTPPLSAAAVETISEPTLSEKDMSGLKPKTGDSSFVKAKENEEKEKSARQPIPTAAKEQRIEKTGTDKPALPKAGEITSKQKKKIKTGSQGMSREQRKKIWSRIEGKMSPEERKRFENMSPEEQRALRSQLILEHGGVER